jgi:hypothetical protein
MRPTRLTFAPAMPSSEGRKRFFFEKKNQKTFGPGGALGSRHGGRKGRLTSGMAVPLLALALSGCGGDPNEEAVQCPKPYLLPDAATLSRYRGQGTDLSDLLLSVKLTDVQGACVGKMGVRVEGAHAHVVMLVARGPAASESSADIPYGVGVVRNGRILDERHYVQHVDFPPNVNTVQATGQEVQFSLPTGKGVGGPSYHLFFWLQLTPAELEANRRRASF